jgi:hypothetical protein
VLLSACQCWPVSGLPVNPPRRLSVQVTDGRAGRRGPRALQVTTRPCPSRHDSESDRHSDSASDRHSDSASDRHSDSASDRHSDSASDRHSDSESDLPVSLATGTPVPGRAGSPLTRTVALGGSISPAGPGRAGPGRARSSPLVTVSARPHRRSSCGCRHAPGTVTNHGMSFRAASASAVQVQACLTVLCQCKQDKAGRRRDCSPSRRTEP